MESTQIFEGKVVVLGGDFRQTLPVVRNGSKHDTIVACITNSHIWPSLCVLQLDENMRALLDPVFTEFLLRLGEGRENLQDDDVVTLPSQIVIVDNDESQGLNVLIKYVYPHIFENSKDNPASFTFNRAILTTKNTFFDELNDILINKFQGEEKEYISFDETLDPNDQAHYEDLLHSLTPHGMHSSGGNSFLCQQITTLNENNYKTKIKISDYTGIHYSMIWKKLLTLTLLNYINENEGNTLDQIVESGLMIFALRVKVTTFYGQSLSISSSPAILINPSVTDDLQLKNWYTNSRTGIKELLQKQTYKDTNILLPPPEERDILPIGKAITRMKNGKPTWIKGTLMLPRHDRSFTQTACANCLKPVVADVKWIITCFACKKQSKVQLKSRAIVEIDDGTSSIAAMISTPEIEKFMKVDYNEIKDAGENVQTVQNIIAKSIGSLPLLPYVRSYQTSNQENHTTRFVVVKAHRLPEHQNENKQELQLSNKDETLSTTKQCSPKQTQKRNHTDSGKAKLTETSTAGTSRPTKKTK
ncbi:unnamed protein product [Lactuca saligna]|uniref:ATP-dependent DNA helicase n=1 Tax=Lactuca saligna TaxID=75948 RepID=A0AA35Y0W8_LACSI|nr:unnamed protein product [Lactuca saligna]